MSPKSPQLASHYVTPGDLSMRAWHHMLSRATFVVAMILMGGSIYALHWATNLIGLEGGLWEAVAWLVPLAIEVGMASVASTATTIRKPARPGRDHGGYYLSLWLIFGFLMMLAQAANIGHAVTVVAEKQAWVVSGLPATFYYAFACAIAILLPLGGTMFVHVSGFLREHGVGAKWIGEDREVVYSQHTPGTGAHPAARTVQQSGRAPERARTADPARVAQPQNARPSAARPPIVVSASKARNEQQVRARAVFDALLADDATSKPDAAFIHAEAQLDCDKATSRRWVQNWWSEREALDRAAGIGQEERAAS